MLLQIIFCDLFKILHSIKIVSDIDYAHMLDRVAEINIFKVEKKSSFEWQPSYTIFLSVN